MEGKPWRVLEFYSGIGGMRYSLDKAGVNAVVVEAFDINDVANDVYEHNFGHRPHQGNIQTLSAADLDRYKAEAWILSPPCQPYTRQGLQKGSRDARASSFLKIIELIPQCSQPPLMLFVENVVGFEISDTHKKMIAMLQENHFQTQEFVLSPLQFGVPYSRPRYFCLAKSNPLAFQHVQFNNVLLRSPGPLLGHKDNMVTCEEDGSHANCDKSAETCQPLRDFLELEIVNGEVISEPKSMHAEVSEIEKETEAINGGIYNHIDRYLVPSSLVKRWGSAMGILTSFVFGVSKLLPAYIVFPESRRCCCFTKSYFRFVKGTGSLLATVPENAENRLLQDLRLRYFTPREVANLHSFPENFTFPHHVSLRQRYALLGNSLSVGVVAPLLRYLFGDQ